MSEPVGILGGGISALAFAHFSGLPCVIFEKEDRAGGLCRSFDVDGVPCDIGPHILFSKDKATLDFMTGLAPVRQLRRSNRIHHAGRFVKYPLENQLAALPEADRDWLLKSFLENPYADYPVDSMLTFFYRKFGEGMTRLYLEPYNRKIWKFEPSFMDTQMVDRIPDPPREDVIRGARGEETEGYLHQLHFYYPERGGMESLVRALAARCADRVKIVTNAAVERVRRLPEGGFEVTAGGRTHAFSRIVTTMPVHELLRVLEPAPPADVLEACRRMLFNSIHITTVHATDDRMGDNFAAMVADPAISFHRVSKMNFLGEAYHKPGRTTLMAEITFREGDRWDRPADAISDLVARDLERVGFVPAGACRTVETRRFRHAYVIYDRHHRANTDHVLAWLRSRGIPSVGRFATFEYINSDQAIALARRAAESFVAQATEAVP